ncbi:hypothetical protein [Euzebya tangerina]|uniref:hypothetical protein n=1 Tax=Euzebya tangerina TaxID=591198 RepID=UPI000E31238B|nr:hypothetical protein [Euzebya tangerina]
MDNPETDPLLGQLDAQMSAEIRAEQAEYEALALQAELRARTLPGVAREMMIRGDRVEVRAAGQVVVGTVSHVGEDYGVIDAARGSVDLVLAHMDLLRTVERVRSGGSPPGRGAKTFRARLTEHQTMLTQLEVLLRDETMVSGSVQAAAPDHLLLATRRGDIVTPWAAVVATWPTPQL